MTTASCLYQKDALGSSDSHLVYYFSSRGNNLPTLSLQKFVYRVCKNNTVDFPSLPRQTVFCISSKKDFLAFNFETDYSTLFPNRQGELLNTFLFIAHSHILEDASLFFSLDLSFLENTNSGLQIILIGYGHSPHLLPSSLQLVCLSLQMQVLKWKKYSSWGRWMKELPIYHTI